MTFVGGGRHSPSATTNDGTPPPLFLGFHPSKRHATLIAPCNQGSIVLAFTFGITRAEAFFMASNASYPDVCSMFLVDLLCAYTLIICKHHVTPARSYFQSCTSSCYAELVVQE